MNEEFYKEMLCHLSKAVDIALIAIEAKNAEVECTKNNGDDSKLDKFFKELARRAKTRGVDYTNLQVRLPDIVELYVKIKYEEE